ncbi:hypothetical protein D3C76_1846980 [compost metagenome]
MKFGLFLLYTTFGTLIWNIILVLLGASVGENWENIVGFMDVYSNIAYAIIAVGIVIALFFWIRSRKKA